jgi:uncharacterized membrane protein YidH (DUF202 family)
VSERLPPSESAATEPVDHGLAAERTDLAWNRSGLAVIVCVAVLLRRIWPLRGTDQVVALACISAGAFAWAFALSVGRSVFGGASPERAGLSPRRAAVITAGTLALALAGVALALVSPS